MRNWGKAPQILVALNCVCFSVAHANDTATPADSAAAPAPVVSESTVPEATAASTPPVAPTATTSEVPASTTASSAMNPTVPTLQLY